MTEHKGDLRERLAEVVEANAGGYDQHYRIADAILASGLVGERTPVVSDRKENADE